MATLRDPQPVSKTMKALASNLLRQTNEAYHENKTGRAAAAKAFYEEGILSMAEIGDVFGISRTAVYKLIERVEDVA